MVTISHIHDPAAGASSVDALLDSLARARGCSTDEEVQRFLNGSEDLHNPLDRLTAIERAVDRVLLAIRNGENITIFGDYDCDGVTSSAQCINLLRAARHSKYRVYIPDRFIEDYGLTMDAVTSCIDSQNPKLIIAVDCGSTSFDALRFLRERGIDVIVLDHHQVEDCDEHPAFAHLNPKGDPRLASDPVLQDAVRMSAAGLAFFFCWKVAERGGFPWDLDANLILAGFGTYADVMPMVGINRELVRRALMHANSHTINRVPGLVELLKANNYTKAITEHTFGFILGPCFNAAGRLTHAKASLSLACAITNEKAKELAVELLAQNNERKRIQESILAEATAQASAIMSAAPETKVLILYGRDWHTGVIGIVAGRIRERFHRPTIVLARLDTGFWKGSGRSIPTIDIGSFVRDAVREKVITGGGGHSNACGVKMTDEELPEFIGWVKENAGRLSNDLVPRLEVVGNVDLLSADEWETFYRLGAPFGQGNPRPFVLAEAPILKWGPEPAFKADRETVWGVKASFTTTVHKNLNVVHTVPTEGMTLIAPQTPLRLVLDFSRSEGKDGRVWDNWKIVHGEIITESEIARVA